MRPALLACLIAVAMPAWAWNDGASTDRDRPLMQLVNAFPNGTSGDG